MSESLALECAVIGAGIAGLTACIALRRAGHNVEVFEKSSFKHEIGAAITLTPNANIVLERWNFDYDKAASTEKLQARRVAADTLELVDFRCFEDVHERFGHRFNASHRVDMHNVLRQMAESNELAGGSKIRLGISVVDVDCEGGILTLQDGVQIQKDLIIIADGIKSRFVKHINGVDVPRQFTGAKVHRTLINMDRLANDDLMGPLIKGQPSGFLSTFIPKNGIFLMLYSCRADKEMNAAIFHRGRDSEEGGDDWNAPADIKDVSELLKDGFNPAWSALVSCAGPDDWKCFPVSKRDPLSRLVRGKAVIVGDAAHACLPTHAQGGAMAIEDAAAFEVLFSNVTSDDSIEKRLRLYEQLRMPRSATTLLLSNAMMYLRDGTSAIERVRDFYQGDVPATAEPWSTPIQEFFYDYDIFAEAEKALRYLDDPAGVPAGALRYFGDLNAANLPATSDGNPS